jgi:hypothetical protein
MYVANCYAHKWKQLGPANKCKANEFMKENITQDIHM